MKKSNLVSAMLMFFVTLIVCFLLFYFIDTFALEPFFKVSLIRGNVPNPIYTLMTYLVMIGVPIGIFITSLSEGFEAGGA